MKLLIAASLIFAALVGASETLVHKSPELAFKIPGAGRTPTQPVSRQSRGARVYLDHLSALPGGLASHEQDAGAIW